MKVLNLGYIKERRQILNKTLQEVAIEVGMKNASTYMKYENGTYSFKAEQLPQLAKSLECNIEDFFS
ncbi:helix-turn-helix transcriptional regulator [Lysinibacillus halotolerans]